MDRCSRERRGAWLSILCWLTSSNLGQWLFEVLPAWPPLLLLPPSIPTWGVLAQHCTDPEGTGVGETGVPGGATGLWLGMVALEVVLEGGVVAVVRLALVTVLVVVVGMGRRQEMLRRWLLRTNGDHK